VTISGPALDCVTLNDTGTAETGEFTAITAVYDDAGALTQAAARRVTYGDCVAGCDLSGLGLDFSKSRRLKVLLWKDLKAMEPICKFDVNIQTQVE